MILLLAIAIPCLIAGHTACYLGSSEDERTGFFMLWVIELLVAFLFGLYWIAMGWPVWLS